MTDQVTEPIAKLFVGQIPPGTTVSALTDVFSPFGGVRDVSLLTHPLTGAHQGCAFITMDAHSSAEKAIEALHGKVSLPHAKKELVVRFAGVRAEDEQRRNSLSPKEADVDRDFEFKLYVGMLSRDTTEEELEQLFQPFGDVLDIHILRNPSTGVSKGSALIKMGSRAAAEAAVSTLNRKYRDKQSPAPLQVRFAYTENEKRLKRIVSSGASYSVPYGIPSSVNYGAAISPTYATTSFRSLSSPASPDSPQGHSVGPYSANSMDPSSPFLYETSQQGMLQASVQPLHAAAAHYGNPASFHTLATQASMAQMAASSMRPQLLPLHPGMPYAGYMPMPSYQYNAPPVYLPISEIAGSSARGPPGCNLFIYNLPDHLTDTDLALMFSQCGSVLSAHVFRDKASQRSKGYGFVSYLHPMFAQQAIRQMDGYVIDGKKLSVRLKKGDLAVIPSSNYPGPYAIQSLSSTSVIPSFSMSQPQEFDLVPIVASESQADYGAPDDYSSEMNPAFVQAFNSLHVTQNTQASTSAAALLPTSASAYSPVEGSPERPPPTSSSLHSHANANTLALAQ